MCTFLILSESISVLITSHLTGEAAGGTERLSVHLTGVTVDRGLNMGSENRTDVVK